MIQSVYHDTLPQPAARRGNIFSVLFDKLTRPHPSITDIEMRRQSKLLAAIMIVLAATSLLACVMTALESVANHSSATYYVIIPVITLIGLYFLNRNGHYRLSANLFIAQTFFVVYFIPLVTHDLSWLFFASMVMIISAILLPWRSTLIVFAGNIAAQIFVALVAPGITGMSNAGIMIVFLVTVSILLTFVQHRTQLEQERQAELRQANKLLRESELSLEHRVEERTRELVIAKEQAEIARKHAEEADRIKSQFLSSMSHELRTPLNAILTFNELMSIGTFGEVNEEQVNYLEKSLQSGRHLLSLINDVLDVTKIQSGMMKLFVEPGFDLSKELETIAVSAEKMLQDKPVKIVRDIDANIPLMTCDKRRVRQVLLNIVSNAVKFTEQGTITLSAKLRGGAQNEVLIAVIDTGPGIPPEQQDIIFQPFVQTENGIKHAGGTGLGLPISKSLAIEHGGRLWVESTPPSGAAFYILLPVQAMVGQEG